MWTMPQKPSRGKEHQKLRYALTWETSRTAGWTGFAEALLGVGKRLT
jgi:hypothetical protein